MKDGLWNLLTILVFFVTGIIIFVFGYTFINPSSTLNPLAPPTLPPLLVLPTSTPTLKQLPDLATATERINTPTDSATETLRPSSTPLPTNTSFVLPTATITPTPTSTQTETPTVSPTSEAYQCSIVSIFPELNSVFPPGGDFDGRWTLRNTGTQVWESGVDVVFVSGTRFQSGGDAFDLSNVAAPGETADAIIDMFAPRDAGTYESFWSLRKDNTLFCTLRLVIRVR